MTKMIKYHNPSTIIQKLKHISSQFTEERTEKSNRNMLKETPFFIESCKYNMRWKKQQIHK